MLLTKSWNWLPIGSFGKLKQDRIELHVKYVTVELYWPHLQLPNRYAEGSWQFRGVALFAMTQAGFRYDNDWKWKWAAFARVLGFGFGISYMHCDNPAVKALRN